MDEPVESVGMEKIFTVPVTGGEAKEIYSAPDSKGTISDIIDYNGNICIWYERYEYNPETDSADQGGLLEVLDNNGNLLEEIDITPIVTANIDSYILDITLDNEGNIYAMLPDSVKVYDKYCSQKTTIKAEGTDQLSRLGKTKDGKIYVFISQDGDLVAAEVKPDADTFGKNYELDVAVTLSRGSIQAGSGKYDFLLKSDSALYGYSLKDERVTKLCDYINSDIIINSISTVVMLDEKNVVTLFDNGMGGYDATLFTKVAPEDVKEKQTLVLMVIYATDSLKHDIIDFNRTHSDVRISLVDYSDYDSPDAKMSADISAGKIPDIYCINYGIGKMSLDQCVSKGLLEDLTPFIEKDEELSEEDFIPSVYNAMKIDGKLYYTAASFDIRTMVANGKFAGNIEGWNFTEMKAYVDNQPEDSRLFDIGDKDATLSNFLYTSMGDFVDWENGKCSFDSPDFKAVLQMCNRGDNHPADYDERESFTDTLRSGKQMFSVESLSPDNIILLDALFEGKTAVVGFPNKEREGVYAEIYRAFGMSSSCKNKDAAWDFLRKYMTKDFQGQNYYQGDLSGYPLRNDVFEMYLNSLSTTEEYEDEYGHIITPREGEAGWGEVDVKVSPFTDSQIKLVKSYVDKVSRVWNYDTSLFTIVKEETPAYFHGDKSLEDVASVIQNRASTYIQENK